eukprot:6214360-Pleurochrysis_carterae.AAC.4
MYACFWPVYCSSACMRLVAELPHAPMTLKQMSVRKEKYYRTSCMQATAHSPRAPEKLRVGRVTWRHAACAVVHSDVACGVRQWTATRSVVHAAAARVVVGLCVAALERVVVEQLLNQIDVREQHPPAAVPFKAERVECVTLRTPDARSMTDSAC